MNLRRMISRERVTTIGPRFAVALLMAAFELTALPSFAQDSSSGEQNPQLQGSDIVGALLTPDLEQRVRDLHPQDARELAHIVARISMLFEPDPSGFRSRLHRWETAAKLWAPIDQYANPAERDALDAESSRLQAFVKAHGGPTIELVTNPRDANFSIIWGSLDQLQQEDTIAHIASKLFGQNQLAAANLVRGLSSSVCVHQLNLFGPQNGQPTGSISQALTIIRNDGTLEAQIGCMRRGFSVAMGFVNEETEIPEPSWAQGSPALLVPSEVDGQILRLFYSKRLVTDMDGRTAIHTMLDEAVANYEHKETQN